MTTWTRNFSGRQPTDEESIQNGDTFERCNLVQHNPHTAICEGITGLTFFECNLVNCDIPEGSTVIRCNTMQVSRCSHLHDNWTDLEECLVDCEHSTSEEIWIDGELVDTIYFYNDVAVE